MALGHGLSRVQTFLLSSLKESTVTRYTLALEKLNNELEEQGCTWSSMSEEDQDMFLAEWIIDGYEAGAVKAEFGWALSAVQKLYPRLRLKVAWKVFDVWGQKVPLRQAPAAPPEFLHAMMAVAMMLNRPHLSLMMVLCYAGLLRVRESLQLCYKDLVVGPTELVLCLGVTKRGTEQKVVLRNNSVLLFVRHFLLHHPGQPWELLIPLSYSACLRWVKRLSFLLGGETLTVTTHTFRRSGASELSRQGLPLQDILLYGRWQSERSAREYIRQGEVAVYRARQLITAELAGRITRWASLMPTVWVLFKQVYHADTDPPKVDRVTQQVFEAFEKALFVKTFQ